MTLHLCLRKWRHPISPEFGVTDNVELTLGRHVVLTWWNAITLVCGKLLETISQSIGNCCKTRAQLQFKGNGADKSILMDKLSRCQINMSLLHYLFLSTGLNSGGKCTQYPVCNCAPRNEETIVLHELFPDLGEA